MERIFIQLVNMSLVAGWLILAVLLIRGIFNKLPKAFRCVLWGLVALRLICPWSIESDMSIIPKAEIIADDGNKISILSDHKELGDNSKDELHSEKLGNNVDVNNSYEGNKIDTTIKENNSVVNDNSNNIIGSNNSNSNKVNSDNAIINTAKSNEKESSFSISIGALSKVWIMGIAFMVVYYITSYVMLKRKVRVSIRYEKNIYLCDNIPSAFILGLVRPKIYVPSDLSKVELDNVIKHERAHLSRHDNWWKPLGFLLLSVYWFNPLVWIAYIMFCKDVELACDEKVVKAMDVAEVKEYSNTLLECSISRKLIVAAPLAFGEVAVKSRIKSVINYKKPTFWVINVSIVISVVIGIGFMTNPTTKNKNNSSNEAEENSETGISDVTDTTVITETNDSIGSNDTVVKMTLEEIISDAIQNKNIDCAHGGKLDLFDSYRIVDVEEKDGKEIYYLQVMCRGYECENGLINPVSAIIGSAVVTVGIDKDGSYVLEEYWEPRDGSLYGSDIRDKCPDNIEDEMIHNHLNTEELEFACDRKATKYYQDKGYELVSAMQYICESEDGLNEYIYLDMLDGTCMSGIFEASYANHGTFVLDVATLTITYNGNDPEDKIVQAFTRGVDTLRFDKTLSLAHGSSNGDYEDGKTFTLKGEYTEDEITEDLEDVEGEYDKNDHAVYVSSSMNQIDLNMKDGTCSVGNLYLSVKDMEGTFEIKSDQLIIRINSMETYYKDAVILFRKEGNTYIYDGRYSINTDFPSITLTDREVFNFIENSNE